MGVGEPSRVQEGHTDPAHHHGGQHDFEDREVLESELVHDHIVVGHPAALEQPAEDKAEDNRPGHQWSTGKNRVVHKS